MLAHEQFFTVVLSEWFPAHQLDALPSDLAKSLYQNATLPLTGLANADVLRALKV
jgi:hypothetical protein